jgi:hypothetical protein
LKNIPWSNARGSLKQIVDLQWKQWKDVNCHKGGKECIVGGCSHCKSLKSELSKRFRHLVRRGFEERMTKMLKDRSGFLEGVPQRFKHFYRNENVRLVKLQFSAGAARAPPIKRNKKTLGTLKRRVQKKRAKTKKSTKALTKFKPPTDSRFMCDNVDVEEI